MVQTQFLQNGLGVFGQGFVLLVAFFWVSEFEKLDFLELMLAEDAARIFSGRPGFGAEASGPGRDINGQLFLGNGFVTIKIVEFNLGGGCEPEIRAFELEKVGREFRQLARAGERRAVHQEWRKDLRVAVLASVNVEEEVRQGPFEARSPAFINGETSSSNFGGGFQIQDSRAFAHFPVWPGLEIEFWGRAPTTNLFVVSSAATNGNRRMGNVG